MFWPRGAIIGSSRLSQISQPCQTDDRPFRLSLTHQCSFCQIYVFWRYLLRRKVLPVCNLSSMRPATHWRNCISLRYVCAHVGVVFFITRSEFDKFITQLNHSRLLDSWTSNLHAVSFYTIVKCLPPWAAPYAVLHDINIVLGTIPESNGVTNLSLDIEIVGQRPFHGCLDQDWVGLFNEVIRIGDGKFLKLELQTIVTAGDFQTEHPGQEELYMRIMEKAASLSDYPKVSTHWWNSTFLTRGLGPFCRGQVRRRCGSTPNNPWKTVYKRPRRWMNARCSWGHGSTFRDKELLVRNA